MNNLDPQLKELYKKILAKNQIKTDRTGVGTKSLFGYQMRFDLREGFPLTTLRKIHIPSLIHELLWFLGSYDEEYKKFGICNVKYLNVNGVSFWNDWCYKNYREEKIRKHDGSSLKELKILSMKDFAKKIRNNDDFAMKWGDLGPIYQKQWVDWGGYKELIPKNTIYKETASNHHLVDNQGYKEVYIKGINQINKLIDTLIENPDSRRMIVSAWNVSDLDDMALEPCHSFWQCYTEVMTIEERIEHCENNYDSDDIQKYMFKNNIEDWDEIKRDPRKQIKILDHFNVPERFIDLQLYQRSQDMYLGNSYNTASYALLLTMLGQVVNMVPREFIHSLGDVHLYTNSFEATEELLKREIRPLPRLRINPDVQNIYGFRIEDFEIFGYDPHPNIKVEVAV